MSRNAGTESGGHASPESSETLGADGLLQINEVVVVEGMTVMSVENRLEASLVVVVVGFKLVLVGHIGVDLACFLGRGRNLHVCTDGIDGEKHNVLRDAGSDARKAVNAEGCAIRIPNFPIVAHFQLVVLVRGRESLVVGDCAIGILQTKYCRIYQNNSFKQKEMKRNYG